MDVELIEELLEYVNKILSIVDDEDNPNPDLVVASELAHQLKEEIENLEQ